MRLSHATTSSPRQPGSRRGRRPRGAAALACLLAAAPASAFELHVGYSFLKDKQLDETFSAGAVAGIGLKVSKTTDFVLQVSGHTKSFDSVTKAPFSPANDLSVATAMGGLRFWGRGQSRLYLQVLAGAARLKTQPASGGPGSVEVLALTKAVVQPGVGLDLSLGKSAALRLGADYRWVFTTPEKVKQWQGHAGLAWFFGGR